MFILLYATLQILLLQGKYIYERGSHNGKRVQSNMGAKNHGVVMPDANKENSLNQLVGAAFGAAGQRCMALSTAVFVGEAQQWLPDLIARAQALKVNAGEWHGFKLMTSLVKTLVQRRFMTFVFFPQSQQAIAMLVPLIR